MLVARRFLIAGRVQGVGFRWFAAEAAAREGIAGYARNLPDRSVEVVGEGEAEAMERFERSLRRGPGHARVDNVETDILEPTGQQVGFSIRG